MALERRQHIVRNGSRSGPLLAAGAWLLTAVTLLALLALPGKSPATSSNVNAHPAAPTDAPAPVVAGHRLVHRWVYIPTNFQVDANVPKVNGLLDRAAAAGYNGALVADVKLGRLDDGSLIPAYYTNLRAVLDHARSLGLDLVPDTADFGYSSTILWHDPNLAEGLPVQGATFRAQAGRLVPYEDPPVRIVNGDFEQLPASGHQFPGWAWQDKPGESTFVDQAVKHGGRASLRMMDLGTTNAPAGNGRIQQRLAVEPFRYYHVIGLGENPGLPRRRGAGAGAGTEPAAHAAVEQRARAAHPGLDPLRRHLQHAHPRRGPVLPRRLGRRHRHDLVGRRQPRAGGLREPGAPSRRAGARSPAPTGR